MIIVRLQGGLGNQLFQYAACRSIAHKINTTFKLDLSWFETVSNRRYALNQFNIIEYIASRHEISVLRRSDKTLANIALHLAERFKPYYRRSYIKEVFYYHFDPHILDIGVDAYLDGFWQNERYFKDISDIIHKEFMLKYKPNKANTDMARRIINTESVSLHIRRGDYVSNLEVNQAFGTCSLEYYNRAIEKLTNVIDRPNFFVFSDDPQWARENLHVTHPATFVVHNDMYNDYEDLRLMSLCKHHIIANSSFSWWGAWLCENDDKIVFAPIKWLNTPKYDTEDLIPASWRRI